MKIVLSRWTQYFFNQDRRFHRVVSIFFRRGCTRLFLYFNTNKPHSFFLFLQNTSCIRKPRVISGRGVRTPCTLPLDPPLYLKSFRSWPVAFSKKPEAIRRIPNKKDFYWYYCFFCWYQNWLVWLIHAATSNFIIEGFTSLLERRVNSSNSK